MLGYLVVRLLSPRERAEEARPTRRTSGVQERPDHVMAAGATPRKQTDKVVRVRGERRLLDGVASLWARVV